MAAIEFFYDFSSPYSYLAATRIRDLALRTGAELRPRPFALGAVFKALGTTLPASSPPRATYMFRDVSAWARDYGIPFQLPEVFPVNAIKAMRSVLAVPDADASWNLALSIFKAYWGEGRDISRPDVISELVGAVGLNAADVLAATERQDIKDTLRGNGEEALARGAFGAPTIFVGEQMFVGNDRLPFVERAARGEQVYP